MAQGSYSPEIAHQALVDGKCHLAFLNIREAHRTLLHAGPQATLYELRPQYRILDGPRSGQQDTSASMGTRTHSRCVHWQ